jgi:hypothetical protein
MHKSMLGLAAAAAMTAATVLAPATADARCRGCGVAAGVIGGLAAGAIIGSAIANNPPPPRAVYVEPDPYDGGPVCHIEHHRVWIEGYGWRWRRFEVCD